MKYYKLIKPLPLYEVGDDGFYIDSEGNLQHATASCGEVVYGAKVLVSHPNILTDWFEEIPEKPKTVWDLEKLQTYYYVNENGYVYPRLYKHEDCDASRRAAGNMFLTEEEAKKELARRKAKAILERDTKGFKPDRKDYRQAKVYVLYNYMAQDFSIYTHREESGSHIYFATIEDAEASIKAHEKEWKIYLGVKE